MRDVAAVSVKLRSRMRLWLWPCTTNLELVETTIPQITKRNTTSRICAVGNHNQTFVERTCLLFLAPDPTLGNTADAVDNLEGLRN